MTKQPGILQSLSKMTEMHFVYAFFFEYKGEVFVKVGQSAVPYKRLDAITHGCPFPLSQAVFVQIGGSSHAKSFELRMKRELEEYRTRGEWYCFDKSDGAKFNEAVREVYAKITGRRLVWSKVDIREYFERQAQAAEKWQGRRRSRALAS